MEMLISFSSRTWHLPHCQRYQKLVQWPWCYCVWLTSTLAWPELHRESLGYCQEEDERHQTQQCRWPEGRYQSNLGFHYTWAVPEADCLHATPHWCSNSCKRRPNQVLSAWKWTYFSEAWHCCLKYPSFGWDVKPRSWLSVVIKNPMALPVKSRGVTPVPWPNSLHWPLSIMAS